MRDIGELLVLELDRGRAGPLVQPHGAVDVRDVAEAGVGVGDQRDVQQEISWTRCAISVWVARPMSGTPVTTDTAAPDM